MKKNYSQIILPCDMEQDIIVLFDDIYNNAPVSELGKISNKGKKILQTFLKPMFESTSTSGSQMEENVIMNLNHKDFKKHLDKYLEDDDFQKFYCFIDSIGELYSKGKIKTDQNNTTTMYAITAILIHAGLLPEGISSSSTSLHLEYSSMIQEKIKDILSLSSQ